MTISPSEITILPLCFAIQDIINPILLERFKNDPSDYLSNHHNSIIWSVLKSTIYSKDKYTKRSVVQVLSRLRIPLIHSEWNEKLVVDILNKIKSDLPVLSLNTPEFTTIHPTILMNLWNSNIRFNVLMDLIFTTHMDALKYYFDHNKNRLNRSRDKSIDDEFIKQYIDYLRFLYSINDTRTIKVLIKYLCYLNELNKNHFHKSDPSYSINYEDYYSIFHNAVASRNTSLNSHEFNIITKMMICEFIDEIPDHEEVGP